jgi:hypothetical protein
MSLGTGNEPLDFCLGLLDVRPIEDLAKPLDSLCNVLDDGLDEACNYGYGVLNGSEAPSDLG